MYIFFCLFVISQAHFFGDAPIYTPQNLNDIEQLERTSTATILMLYAPWCGHCKHLAPEFAQAATNVNGKALFAAVDCTEHEDICGRYGVQGYPTVKVFDAQKGRTRRVPRDYNGPREAQAIENMMYSKIPDWIEELPEELDTTKNAVILFSDKAKRTLMFKAIAMNAIGAYTFYDCTKQKTELVEKYGVTSFPSLFIQINGELKKYEGKLEFYSILDHLQALVGGASYNAQEEEKSNEEEGDIPYENVHVLNDEMLKTQCNGKACLVLIFGEEENVELGKEIAAGLKGKMHTCSFTCAEQNGVCNKLNVFYDTPTALIFVPQRGRLIRFVGGFNAQEVITFAKESLLGRTGRMENLPEFPHMIDRVVDPYVPPVYEEEL